MGASQGGVSPERRTLLGAALGACGLAGYGLAGYGLAGCAGAMQALPPLPQYPIAAPGPPEQVLQRIAFGSCVHQDQPQPVWQAVLAQQPDAFIFAGDNVYASGLTFERERLHAAYLKAGAQPGLAAVRAQIPHWAIWDDHDYGVNDGGAEFADKPWSKAQFLAFWQVSADDPRRQREGLYHAVVQGPPGRRVQVILLDTRWFRSPLKATDQRNAPGKERFVPDADPTKTMLGEKQWAWLREQLLQPAELRLLVSSVQVLAQGHGYEHWGNLPLELSRLLVLLSQTRAQGVVILSGDRHLGAIYQHDQGAPYRLTEITSSGLTQAFANAPEPGPNRLGPVLDVVNFGVIDIDWAARQVRLSLKDVQGVQRRQVVLRLDELSALSPSTDRTQD